jgi:hypothetical protein
LLGLALRLLVPQLAHELPHVLLVVVTRHRENLLASQHIIYFLFIVKRCSVRFLLLSKIAKILIY